MEPHLLAALVEVVVRPPPDGGARRALEAEAVLGGVQLPRPVQRPEEAVRERLAQLPEDPAGLVELHHVPRGVGPGVELALRVPRLGVAPPDRRADRLDKVPHPIQGRLRLARGQDPAQHRVALILQLRQDVLREVGGGDVRDQRPAGRRSRARPSRGPRNRLGGLPLPLRAAAAAPAPRRLGTGGPAPADPAVQGPSRGGLGGGGRVRAARICAVAGDARNLPQSPPPWSRRGRHGAASRRATDI
mmetsp:Transcript_27716/g.73209  ORF Transcript_27716/g.73209 Transcript_27716/m.73209 type:complete len:246 (+) Transcript_27716:380-1117(+)